MAQKERRGEEYGPSSPADIANAVDERMKDMSGMQKEIVDAFTKINQRWMTQASAQARLASELGTKLAAARTLPDVAAAYQDWIAQQNKMIAEENQRFTADSLKMMKAMLQMFPRTWSSAST